jgi:hypothetical protein
MIPASKDAMNGVGLLQIMYPSSHPLFPNSLQFPGNI